ncbi:MAG: hypothetical protein IJS69_04795 [Selenomonadaceae bacterium]|nr:hypothetical protein [Selenomonadaceae bacterium]
MKKFFALIFITVLLMTGCGQNSQAREAKTLDKIKISVNGKNFYATLEDNPTARAFAERLPLEADMQELNGNEKYFYLDKNLPSDSVRVGQIHSGELMLFGSNCLVIFYKDFATSYSYTRLGKLDDSSDLEKILGNGNVRVTFTK